MEIRNNILYIKKAEKPTYFSLSNNEYYPDVILEDLDVMKIKYEKADPNDPDMPPYKDIPKLDENQNTGANERVEFKTDISFDDLKEAVFNYIYDLEEGKIKDVVIE